MARESHTAKKQRAFMIMEHLSAQYSNAHIALNYTNALELLIATMLSAQCTDERVNIVTAKLFMKYRSPQDYCAVAHEELERDIFSTGFYKAKARNIKLCCQALIDRHQGEVPGTLEELTALAGVGRKTANVVLGHWFDIPGMVVDTHVTRLVNRMGFCKGEDAVKLEFALMKLIPQEQWVRFTHLMIHHGRAICTARKAHCEDCVIRALCLTGTQKSTNKSHPQ